MLKINSETLYNISATFGIILAVAAVIRISDVNLDPSTSDKIALFILCVGAIGNVLFWLSALLMTMKEKKAAVHA